MAEGFLGRWSQRKQTVRAGKPVADAATGAEAPATQQRVTPMPIDPLANQPAVESAPDPGSNPQGAPAPPTLQDVQALTHESDFRRFAGRNVAPEIRNAAMKKLFAAPHFSVMDRLDTYIDDYSQPDPLPESMLRNMVSAKFLQLFEETPQAASKDQPDRALCDEPASLAQNTPHQTGTDHDHTDLRLQPDPAARPGAPGRSAE